jgi:arabinose-5-phosphate isomerase
VALVLPRAEEACSIGRAPTTSTTMTIALGDALAVAMMERRDFTLERFRTFHPGGRLGAELVRVRDIMATGEQVPLVAEDTPMPDTLIEMSAKGFGAAGVVDGAGRLKGVITDGDLRRKMTGLLERSAGEVATPEPRTIGPDALAQEALALMTERTPRITTLFVCEADAERRAIGILHVHHCLQAGLGGS